MTNQSFGLESAGDSKGSHLTSSNDNSGIQSLVSDLWRPPENRETLIAYSSSPQELRNSIAAITPAGLPTRIDGCFGGTREIDFSNMPDIYQGCTGFDLRRSTESPRSLLPDISATANNIKTALNLDSIGNIIDFGRESINSVGEWFQNHFNAPVTITDKLRNASSGIERAFSSNHSSDNSSVNHLRVFDDMTRGGYLGKNTNVPPMHDDAYTATLTRDTEQAMMNNLMQTTGPISHERLARTAINAAGGDEALATLALMNFSKNLASVNRGQGAVGQNPTSLWPENTYSVNNANSVYNRIETFNDTPQQSNYDRAGSLYHFYGAMAAERFSTFGLVGAAAERTFFAKEDGIENAAGVVGAMTARRIEE